MLLCRRSQLNFVRRCVGTLQFRSEYFFADRISSSFDSSANEDEHYLLLLFRITAWASCTLYARPAEIHSTRTVAIRARGALYAQGAYFSDCDGLLQCLQSIRFVVTGLERHR